MLGADTAVIIGGAGCHQGHRCHECGSSSQCRNLSMFFLLHHFEFLLLKYLL